jgi:hypothetical protein
MKMLLLSPMLVTQSLTRKAALLTLLNKRLKCGAFHSAKHARLNRLLSKNACLPSFAHFPGLKQAGEEA